MNHDTVPLVYMGIGIFTIALIYIFIQGLIADWEEKRDERNRKD